jgi:hypothetical protein
MKSIFLPFLAAGLFVSACSKPAGTPKVQSGTDKESKPSLVLHATDDKVSVTKKPGPKQEVVGSTMDKPDESLKPMAPQPTLINGRPASAQIPRNVDTEMSAKPIPASQFTVVQTPMVRAQARTQAMEEMLRARKQAETPAGSK